MRMGLTGLDHQWLSVHSSAHIQVAVVTDAKPVPELMLVGQQIAIHRG
jgi:hypothetical protein